MNKTNKLHETDGYSRGEFIDEYSHYTVPMMNKKPEPKPEFFLIRWVKDFYRQWKYWHPYN